VSSLFLRQVAAVQVVVQHASTWRPPVFPAAGWIDQKKVPADSAELHWSAHFETWMVIIRLEAVGVVAEVVEPVQS
jgi:hypothetical protein